VIWELLAALVLGIVAVWFIMAPLRRPGLPVARVVDPFDVEETRRGRAIDALREIEFDRATGKLSDEDYASLKARYTGLAVQAMRDERAATPDDADIEAMIAARREGVARDNSITSRPPPDPESVLCYTSRHRQPTRPNSARFCAAKP
jgi:hypothetical protein